MRYTEGLLLLSRICWCFLAAGIAIGELIPVHSPPMGFVIQAGISDKLIHAAAYALLVVISTVFESRRRAFQMAALSFLFGVALEFAQKLTPDRHFELADIASNGCGVILGVLSGSGLRRRFDPASNDTPISSPLR